MQSLAFLFILISCTYNIFPVNCQQYHFVKLYKAIDNVVPISTNWVRSNLECVTFCVKNDMCSLAVFTPNQQPTSCLGYTKTTFNNHLASISVYKNQSDMWYKERGLSIDETADDTQTTTPDVTVSVASSNCPPPFTEVASGCCYISSNVVSWDEAQENCDGLTGDSVLAHFDTITVSIH